MKNGAKSCLWTAAPFRETKSAIIVFFGLLPESDVFFRCQEIKKYVPWPFLNFSRYISESVCVSSSSFLPQSSSVSLSLLGENIRHSLCSSSSPIKCSNFYYRGGRGCLFSLKPSCLKLHSSCFVIPCVWLFSLLDSLRRNKRKLI